MTSLRLIKERHIIVKVGQLLWYLRCKTTHIGAVSLHNHHCLYHIETLNSGYIIIIIVIILPGLTVDWVIIVLFVLLLLSSLVVLILWFLLILWLLLLLLVILCLLCFDFNSLTTLLLPPLVIESLRRILSFVVFILWLLLTLWLFIWYKSFESFLWFDDFLVWFLLKLWQSLLLLLLLEYCLISFSRREILAFSSWTKFYDNKNNTRLVNYCDTYAVIRHT